MPKIAACAFLLGCGPFGAWLALQLGLGIGNARCGPFALLILLVIAPAAEETVFRFGLHRWLGGKLQARAGSLSLANVLVALLFGSLHAVHQGSPLMFLTAVPALILGWSWELSAGRLVVPVLLHAWYNLCIVVASCP
jgi:membrane protease YdiL (CAAX protease family)